MSAANKPPSGHAMANVLLFATVWGGAWAIGFLLGFG